MVPPKNIFAHFLQHSTLLHPIKFSNVHNHEVKTMCNTRVLHNVWVLNNNRHTHKITIVCIVNHNVYHIRGHYIYYGILNVTMVINSCNGWFKIKYWWINFPLKNYVFTRKTKYTFDDVSFIHIIPTIHHDETIIFCSRCLISILVPFHSLHFNNLANLALEPHLFLVHQICHSLKPLLWSLTSMQMCQLDKMWSYICRCIVEFDIQVFCL